MRKEWLTSKLWIIICLCILASELEAFAVSLTEVQVEPAIIKEIDSLDRRVVFFTSSKQPIRNLSDVKFDQFAWFGLDRVSLYKIMDILVKTGVKSKSDERLGTMMGNAYFPELFSTSTLRLFVTTMDVHNWKEIGQKGGGIQIKFVIKNK